MLDAVIVGAGPAGLAAGYEMARQSASVTVVERLLELGGLSRTVQHDGCRYDIGPHRFFTRNEEVNKLFMDVVADDTVHVPRLTRIFYNNQYFNYPLTPLNALFGVGIGSSIGILSSYLATRIQRQLTPREPENFEEWVTDQFGAKLFQTFFKTYTEKVWGIPCTQIGADWAGQRIKGLSLGAAVWNAISHSKSKKIKTLIDEFMFPRLGAGQFYEKMADLIAAHGNTVKTGCRVVQIIREGFRVQRIVVEDEYGQREELEAKNFMSSAPLTEMVEMLSPAPPAEVLQACRSLRYRDHIGVHLKLAGDPFPDNWIYVHSKQVRMARIANYRNFSHAMADRLDVSPLTIEYFTFKGDEVWRQSDEELVAMAGQELAQMNIAKPGQVLSGFVVRSEKAYPVIETGFQQHIDTIKQWLDRFENLTPIGRSGMFKYNNQDHAIYTGLLAARTAMGYGKYDPWRVNIDAEYHEGGAAGSVVEERLKAKEAKPGYAI
ncbi:MAG: FAD-dependent oxidoreductase [Blastocatellia bacterium]